jgi:hypothetical protein
MRDTIANAVTTVAGVDAGDVVRAGIVFDIPLLRTELLGAHRVSDRRFLAEMLPKNGVGAEIGVFTGLFSTILLDVADPRQMYFVDPWWDAFGKFYPDWGSYNDHGRLETKVAYRAAKERIAKHTRKNANSEVVVGYSTSFLPTLSDGSLDWAYLDSTHSYEGTRDELALLKRKIRPGGILAGDDWYEDPMHVHAGVAMAAKEAVARGDYILIGAFACAQWALRVPE